MKAEYYIKKLNLLPHPEGGYYKEIYRSSLTISEKCLPDYYSGSRNYSTSILFLLNKTDKSKFHILNSDEIWHFYAGTMIKIYIISPQGELIIKKLGNNLDENEFFQVVIPAKSYFAAEVADKNSFGFVGCTVAPGFDFKDFYMPSKKELLKQFPQHSDIIKLFQKN